MNRIGKWFGSPADPPQDVIEFQVPEMGLGVVFLVSAAKDQPKARLCLLSPNELPQIHAVDWVKASGIPAEAIEAVRLIGAQSRIDEFQSVFENASLPLGKPVPLEQAKARFHFIPDEGRLRIESSETKPRRIRVLVVDDSETIRRLLTSLISQDPSLECVGTVDRPSKVERAIQELRPDVVTLDIHMPETTGTELLKQLLPKYPLPFIMISSLSMDDGRHIIEALEIGAVDYIQKPSMLEIKELAPIISEKIKTASKIKVGVNSKRLQSIPPASAPNSIAGEIDFRSLIVIGSSTGGTEALKIVLTSLPEKIPPILIVQHIPAAFSKAFAERMNQICLFEVKEAETGDIIEPSKALIAPGGLHMRVKKGAGGRLVVSTEDTPAIHKHKPSVDALFDSIHALNQRHVVAAILTGMGNDGAEGLLKLRKQGARTLAQDEATSVVYGMPQEAVRLGAVEKVVPIQDVAATLIRFCRKKQVRKPAA